MNYLYLKSLFKIVFKLEEELTFLAKIDSLPNLETSKEHTLRITFVTKQLKDTEELIIDYIQKHKNL